MRRPLRRRSPWHRMSWSRGGANHNRPRRRLAGRRNRHLSRRGRRAVALIRRSGRGPTRRLTRAARPIGDGWSPHVRVSDVVGAPAAIWNDDSARRPTAAKRTPAKRRAVLSNESAHVLHGDFYVLLLAALNRAVFGSSPFAGRQLTRLAKLAEMISDDAAIEVLADRPSYADILLDLAGDVRRAPAGLAMARAATVRQRVERILSARGLPKATNWRTQAGSPKAVALLVAICAVTIAKGTMAQNAPPPATRADGTVITDALVRRTPVGTSSIRCTAWRSPAKEAACSRGKRAVRSSNCWRKASKPSRLRMEAPSSCSQATATRSVRAGSRCVRQRWPTATASGSMPPPRRRSRMCLRAG